MRAKQGLLSSLRAFFTERRANISLIYALAIIPVLGAVGFGVDMTRAIYVQQRLAAMLDAAALAVGAQPGLTEAQAQTVAQNYFNANNTLDPSFGVPETLGVTIAGQSVRVSTSVAMPTTIAKLIGIDQVPLAVSSNVVWGQTKLWVSLVLDNTGSMTQTDGTGLSKISALKTATTQLLDILAGAALTPGDVQVALIPFSKTVNVGSANSGASWIDWTDWASAPANATNVRYGGTQWSDYGPSAQGGYSGGACPWSNGNNGFACQSNGSNGSSSASTIPATAVIDGATIPGPICPTVDNGSRNSGRGGRYYNGCFDSVPTTSSSTTNTNGSSTVCSNKASCTAATYCTGYPQTNSSTSTSGNTTTVTTTMTTCSCVPSGGGGKQTCTRPWTTSAVATTVGPPFSHTWHANSHSTWNGCIMDRNQNYDAQNTAPTSAATNFPAENAQSCVPSVMTGTLNYSWNNLKNAVNAMSAGGSTNQTIGLAWGWMAQTNTAPLSAPSLPANTARYIILVSDGLNTQNRWSGNGSSQSSAVDDRMAQACANAKADGFIIYTVFVDLAGTQGNSSVLQSCATDGSKYFDLTTSGQLITTLNQIGQQITNLHVAQ